MAEHVVKTCDKCGKRQPLFNTLGWVIVSLAPHAENDPTAQKKVQYDTCPPCALNITEQFFKYDQAAQKATAKAECNDINCMDTSPHNAHS